MDSLSRGMQQKLSLARALIHDPKILVMDEPTADLDPATRFEFRQILASLADSGKTILTSSRTLTEISDLCTDIGILDRGRLVMEGKIHEVLDRVDASNPIIISIAGNLSSAMQTLKHDRLVKSISIRDKNLLITYAGTQKDESALLRRLIAEKLTKREADILRRRYGLDGRLPQTQRQVAAHYGISRSYVSRLEKKALGKLEEALRERM